MKLWIVIAAWALASYIVFKEPQVIQTQHLFVNPLDSLWVIKDKLNIRDPLLFFCAASITKPFKSIKWGEFIIQKDATIVDILYDLWFGKPVIRKLTIPEGWTTVQIQETILLNPYLKENITSLPTEGMLLPGTYSYIYGMKRQDLIHQMEVAMKNFTNKLLKTHKIPFPLKNLQEWITLASLVEKETSLATERPRIAAVFLNRLKKKMRLQCDPTVIFALGNPSTKLLKRDLKVRLPYNTYYIYGLPPGPIACPGKASLEAVLSPSLSNEIYFVADGKGGHSFSESYKKHLQNVRLLRKLSFKKRIS